MKIYSNTKAYATIARPAASGLVSGSTSVSAAPKHMEADVGSSHLETGVAVSVLPSDVQKRLHDGQEISVQEFQDLKLSIVE